MTFEHLTKWAWEGMLGQTTEIHNFYKDLQLDFGHYAKRLKSQEN